jgi:hypothetical protein
MTPREFDAILIGLKEYRDEERRAMQDAVSNAGGNRTIGGQYISNL